MLLPEAKPLQDTYKELKLKIEIKKNTCTFYYSIEKSKWNLLKGGVDAKFLSTKTAGGGLWGARMYTMQHRPEKKLPAGYFNRFESKGTDELYKKKTFTKMI